MEKRGNTLLIEFIECHLKNGKSIGQITEALLSKGWNSDVIDRALRDVSRTNASASTYKLSTRVAVTHPARIPTRRNKVIGISIFVFVIALAVVLYIFSGVSGNILGEAYATAWGEVYTAELDSGVLEPIPSGGNYRLYADFTPNPPEFGRIHYQSALSALASPDMAVIRSTGRIVFYGAGTEQFANLVNTPWNSVTYATCDSADNYVFPNGINFFDGHTACLSIGEDYYIKIQDVGNSKVKYQYLYPPVYGCIDSTAHNFDSSADTDDGSCETCTDNIQNADETEIDCGGILCGVCSVLGCTDPAARNYDPTADTDDGSCESCSDGIQNGAETSVDCGFVCGIGCRQSCADIGVNGVSCPVAANFEQMSLTDSFSMPGNLITKVYGLEPDAQYKRFFAYGKGHVLLDDGNWQEFNYDFGTHEPVEFDNPEANTWYDVTGTGLMSQTSVPITAQLRDTNGQNTVVNILCACPVSVENCGIQDEWICNAGSAGISNSNWMITPFVK